jgi:hypothetical protein
LCYGEVVSAAVPPPPPPLSPPPPPRPGAVASPARAARAGGSGADPGPLHRDLGRAAAP